MQNERKGLGMGHTLNGISARSQSSDACGPQQMTNDGKKSIWMIDKSSLLFVIWMCEKWWTENLSSCLLYQTLHFYFLWHYPLSQLKVDFLRRDLLICDAFGLPPLSISPLCALSKAQGCLPRHLLTLFETCSDSLCLNGLICIFSWVGFLAEAAAPLAFESDCRCKVAPQIIEYRICACLLWKMVPINR